MIRYDARWRSPQRPIKVFLNGRAREGVLAVVMLWNGGPGCIRQISKDSAGRILLNLDGDEVASHCRFGLVRVDEL